MTKIKMVLVRWYTLTAREVDDLGPATRIRYIYRASEARAVECIDIKRDRMRSSIYKSNVITDCDKNVGRWLCVGRFAAKNVMQCNANAFGKLVMRLEV